MNGYLYETHSHTSEGSACGKVSGSDYIDFMKRRGFQGMIVTDHFFNGNCAVPKNLPWNERVERYVLGYEKAKQAAEGQDFDVIFGVEFNFRGDEYLLYGVDKTWLLENDDLLVLSRREVCQRVHEAGAVMIHAHPYRERGYLSDIKLTPDICDGIEVYNAANPDYQNALGYQYALELKVPMTAGSDIHFFHEDAMGGMLLPHRISDPGAYRDLLMSGEAVPVRITSDGTLTAVSDLPELTIPSQQPTLPVYYF